MTTKHKQGETREDGMVFWCYQKKINYEYWITAEKFAEMRSKKNKKLKAWRSKNKDAVRIWRKNDRQKNLLKRRQQSLLWAKKNPEKKTENLKRWKIQNKDRCTAIQELRRARQMKAVPSDSWKSVVNGFYEISNRVSKCTGIKHAVDHIIPLACGGSHCHRNLQVLPFSINSRKGAKTDFVLPKCYRRDGWGAPPKD
jgi:5-methylcytosine-specific restriction endonuclease McrA